LPGNLLPLGKKFFPVPCFAALKPLKTMEPPFGIEDAQKMAVTEKREQLRD
jgi:hypothetical protein